MDRGLTPVRGFARDLSDFDLKESVKGSGGHKGHRRMGVAGAGVDVH